MILPHWKGRKLSAAILLIILLLGVFAIYVRLAPIDAARWHVPVTVAEDKDLAGGVFRVISMESDTLQKLDQIALQSPRTTRVAGSPKDGHVTYMSRSRWMGFPDFTTAQVVDGELRLYARLRFGKADLGVNKTRVETWLALLKK